MLKVLNIEYLGYAGATMGGVGFVINLDVPKGRFPNIQEGMAKLSVTVPIDNEEKLRYYIISRLVGEKGKISHWREDVELTNEEINIIETSLAEQNILQIGTEIANEYKEKQDLLFKLYDELDEVSGFDGLAGLQSLLENRKVIQSSPRIEKEKELRKKIDMISNRLRELEDLKVS